MSARLAPLFTFTPFIAAVSNLSQLANALSGSIAGFNVANISFKLNPAGAAAGASGVTAASLAASLVLVFIAPGCHAGTPNPAVAAAAVPFVGTDPAPLSISITVPWSVLTFMCSPFLTLFRKEESEL